MVKGHEPPDRNSRVGDNKSLTCLDRTQDPP